MSLRRAALVVAVFCVVGFPVFWPALHGTFIGDDNGYIVNNVYIHQLGPGEMAALFEPTGPSAQLTANYAPLHMLVHGAQWAVFGEETFGYHVTNVVAHALASALLVLLFASAGIPRSAALGLGAIFLLHPANVETVAWIFQIKTILALALSTAALLAFPRRRALACLLYVAALLMKFSAAAALVFVALQLWTRGSRDRRDWGWLGVCCLSTALCAIPEFLAFQDLGNAQVLSPYPDEGVHVRSIVAYAARYIAMAATGIGVSTFHEPSQAVSWLDPWFLLGVALLGVLAARFALTCWRRSEEAVWWGWAIGGYAPVSQVFPFLYPMGDRYLYFVLPGLLGGAFFWARDAWGDRRLPAPRLAAAALALLLLSLAWTSHGRADVWRSELTTGLDAARHYPEGRAAIYIGARRAAQAGDKEKAFAALDRLIERGYDGFLTFSDDPAVVPLRSDPRYRDALKRMADNWIHAMSYRHNLIQPDLRMLALAQIARGDTQAALEAYQQALERGGPLDATVRTEMELVRRTSGGS